VLLPAHAWFERGGHICTVEGDRRQSAKILDPIAGLKGLDEVLKTICDKLGVKMGAPTAPCCEICSSKVSPDLAKQVQVEEV
jgi:formate dehydrogenase major subunit